MILRIFIYFLILLLQSCSGGRIGNFLELSFNNIEKDKSKIDIKNSSTQKPLTKNRILKDSNKTIINKINNDVKSANSKINIQKKENLKFQDINNNNQIKVMKKDIIEKQNTPITNKNNYQSYRFIIILKGVDPTAPSQNFSNVLKNANINFEIESIERFQENNSKKLK